MRYCSGELVNEILNRTYIPISNQAIIQSLLSPPTLPLHPVSVAPPSISIAFPVICALPLLLKNSTNPPKSLGLPTLPVGCPDARATPYFSNPKFVMREGNTPGHIAFTMTFFGASFEACILVRWIHAAFAGPSVAHISTESSSLL
jgi:hypothetical protein